MNNKSGLGLKYFVLKPKGTDIYAEASRAALITYAKVIEMENFEMANDLLTWVRLSLDNSFETESCE